MRIKYIYYRQRKKKRRRNGVQTTKFSNNVQRINSKGVGGGGGGGNTYHFLTNEKPPFKHICFFVLLLHSLVSEEGREKIFYEKPFGESGEKKYLGGSCLFVGVNNNIIIPLSSHP